MAGFLGLTLVVFASGCGMKRVVGFRTQMAQASEISEVRGRIDIEGGARGSLVVVIAEPGAGADDAPVPVDTYVRSTPGTYAFRVQPGRYVVGAYEDRNGNGALDPGERMQDPRGLPDLEVPAGAKATKDLRIAGDSVWPADEKPLDVFDIIARTPREQRRFSLWAWSKQGAVCEDLEDDVFGPENGQRGLWEVMNFVNEGIAGVYFLEEYDPGRIPVLFVHGIGGYPQELSTLMASLDRERFQPWFYFYPSGFSLAPLSDHLATLLKRLQIEHGFDELAVVGYSMGGLVSRGAILDYRERTERDDVRLFVSISTPWGGAASARRAERAPIVLPPVFSDMNPDSDQLRTLFWKGDGEPERLGEETAFHMLFGYRMQRSRPVADDGVVTVASQTRAEARDRAVSRWPFDEDHGSILEAPEVADRMNAILDERFGDR